MIAARIMLIFLATTLLAQTAAVPVAQEPSHHLVLDNEYVRAFDVVVAPHAATLLHQHDLDYVFVTLGDSHISNERAGSAPVELKLADAEVRYTPGRFAHVARNLAATPFHNITIELKNPGAPVCGLAGLPACEKRPADLAQVLFATRRMRASLTDLAPGARTALHSHTAPHLAIALDGLTFENDPKGNPPRKFSMKKGQAVWVDESVTHLLRNLGPARGRILALEFK